MAHYVVTGRQLLGTVLSITVLVASVIIFFWMFINYLDLPEVYIDSNGKCVKVINYRNGDAYQCQDKDVTLRTYRPINVR